MQNSILNLPIFSFKISKSILDFKMPKKKKTLYILQSVLVLVLSTCIVVRKRNPYYLLLLCKCIFKKSMKNDSKGRARTKKK